MKHTDLKKAVLRRPGVRAEYDALGPEFELLWQMLGARTKAGLSQADVAMRMGTQAPAITRLESALGSGKHSPSIDTSWWHRPLACARSQDGCATISSTPSVVYECFVV